MAAPEKEVAGKVCSAREVLEEFKNSGVRVAWPRLADLLKVPPQMIHRILKRHEPEMMVNEDKSLTAVLDHWEDNDPNHTWDVLCLALLSDRVYKELGASLYSKHVKPEEFTVDLVYEEIKDLTDDHLEIAYVLVENSKRLREIWGDDADKLTFEERTKRVIDHWMKNNPASSWLLLAKRLDWYIHGEHEIAAQELAAKIRDKYIPKVEERRAYGPPEGFSEERKILKEFSAQEAYKELTAVEDWFGLGWFLKVEEKELKEIEKRHGRDDDRKLDMLEKWVETQPKTASWNDLAFAVKKMPQHQSLAQDIEEKLFEQKQAEIRDKNLRSLYTDHFFSRLVESLCDDQTRSFLIDQLASLSLISEIDKETQLSSTLQDPRQRAVSLLLLLNIEEKPQKLIDLMRAMSNVDKMKTLVDEMSAQYKAMEAPGDPSAQYPSPPAMEEKLNGVHIVDQIIFQLKGEKPQPLLWEEHGFRMFVPKDALLPDETCQVTVTAIDAGLFEFPEGTEPVSAVYAVSPTIPLRVPAKIEMQHCIKLEKSENSKYMSFVVASQDSVPYKFESVPGGIFKENSYYGSIERQQFSLIGWVWRLLGYAETAASKQYGASTFQHKEGYEYRWILAVTQNLKTMKKNLTNSLKGKEPDAEMIFSFEENELTLEIEEPATPGWIIEPAMRPCTISKELVDSCDPEEGPILCKVRIAFEQQSNPPTFSLRNSIQIDGIKPKRSFPVLCDAVYIRRTSSVSSNGEAAPLSPSLESPLDQPPAQSTFLNIVVKKISAEWYTFGAYLDIDNNSLKGIPAVNKSPLECFLDVFSIWQKGGCRPFKWQTVIDVLDEMDQKTLRSKVIEHLRTNSLTTSL